MKKINKDINGLKMEKDLDNDVKQAHMERKETNRTLSSEEVARPSANALFVRELYYVLCSQVKESLTNKCLLSTTEWGT